MAARESLWDRKSHGNCYSTGIFKSYVILKFPQKPACIWFLQGLWTDGTNYTSNKLSPVWNRKTADKSETQGTPQQCSLKFSRNKPGTWRGDPLIKRNRPQNNNNNNSSFKNNRNSHISTCVPFAQPEQSNQPLIKTQVSSHHGQTLSPSTCWDTPSNP